MLNKPNLKVLVVDEENDILELLTYILLKEGCEVKTSADGKNGVEIAKNFLPDLIILDIMMSQQDGIETCRQLRELPELENTQIIFLTARTEEYAEIAAFENGANDYIKKPIKPRALMSRINARFKRDLHLKEVNNNIKISNLNIDKTSHTVSVGEKNITLAKKEFELLYFLVQNGNTVISRDEIFRHIWRSEMHVLPRTVDVHICKIREKIGKKYITTIKGVGYKFKHNE